jgi:hypothetical protein
MLCGLAALAQLADNVVSEVKETVDAAVLSIRNEIAAIVATNASTADVVRTAG